VDIHQTFVVFHVPEEEFNRLLSKSDMIPTTTGQPEYYIVNAI